MDQFDQLDDRLPLQEDFDPVQALADGRDDLAAALIDEFGGEKMPMARIASPLWGCYAIWGFEGMMTMVAERPDLVDYACRRLTQQTINSIRLKARLGAGVIWIEECLTDMVSPAVYEKFCLPYLQQLVAAMRREGVQSIEYYCGNPAGEWDLLFEIGADALALEESKKGFVIDIAEAAERAAGRCALLGNLDAMQLLAQGSETELRREIARQIAAGRRNRNRFVMSLGSPVTPATSAGRVRLYTDLARELGSTATASTSIR